MSIDTLELALEFTEQYEGGVPRNRLAFAQALRVFAGQIAGAAIDEQRKLRPEAYDDLLAACEAFDDALSPRHHTATWHERLAIALGKTQDALKKAKGGPMTPDELHDTAGWLGECPVCGGELDGETVETWLIGNSTPTRVHSECEGGNDERPELVH